MFCVCTTVRPIKSVRERGAQQLFLENGEIDSPSVFVNMGKFNLTGFPVETSLKNVRQCRR